MKKMADLNMVANLNPWCVKGTGFFEETEVDALGRERAESEYPTKSFLDAGVNCSFGTDYGSSFTYDTVECFYILTNRMEKSGDESTLLNADERLSNAQALSVMTSGGAYQMFREDTFGTLEDGKQANLVILSKDMIAAEGQDIVDTEVMKTMYNGKWVYEK